MMTEPHGSWLGRQFDATWVSSDDDDAEQAKLRAVARLGEEGRAAARRDRAEASPQATTPASRDGAANRRRHAACIALWDICVREQNYRVRLAAAQELGAAGSVTFDALQLVLRSALDDGRDLIASTTRALEPRQQRPLALQGWILPLRASAVDSQHTAGVKRLIVDWIDLLAARGSDTISFCSIEASWAQGFKYEANLRPSCADPAMHRFLVEQAERMAGDTQLWFSRICLLHAFTLWSLRDAVHSDDDGRATASLAVRRAGSRDDNAATTRDASWEAGRSATVIRWSQRHVSCASVRCATTRQASTSGSTRQASSPSSARDLAAAVTSPAAVSGSHPPPAGSPSTNAHAAWSPRSSSCSTSLRARTRR